MEDNNLNNGNQFEPQNQNRSQNQNQPQDPNQPPRMPDQRMMPERKPPKKHTGLVVAAILLAVLFLFGSVFSFVLRLFSGSFIGSSSRANDDLKFGSPYIAELTINGTIQDTGSDSIMDQATYHHSWTVNKIEQLKNDSNNRGLIFFVNTPGGGVYESDELYYAIKDYKEKTGRPVYSYMASQATSGGYYISAPCDKIFANRNCWTGSIGVTIGTLYDITDLLKKYGVKTVTIDSGANKSMGSYTEKLTDEQKEILQGLVDEAYEQFVGIVAEGRHMDIEKVKKLGDGRLYTAKQAKKNGLIDEVGTFDDAVAEMKKTYELDGCTVQDIKYPEKDSFIRDLLQSVAGIRKGETESEIDSLKALMDENGKFSVTYLASIEK